MSAMYWSNTYKIMTGIWLCHRATGYTHLVKLLTVASVTNFPLLKDELYYLMPPHVVAAYLSKMQATMFSTFINISVTQILKQGHPRYSDSRIL